MSYRDKFFGGYAEYMRTALDAIALQQKATAQNIANVNNANYHPEHVNFQDHLKKMYDKMWGGEGDLDVKLDFDPEIAGEEAQSPASVVRDPVNHVDLNHEMADLSRIQVMYAVAENAGRNSFSKYVIETLTK